MSYNNNEWNYLLDKKDNKDNETNIIGQRLVNASALGR